LQKLPKSATADRAQTKRLPAKTKWGTLSARSVETRLGGLLRKKSNAVTSCVQIVGGGPAGASAALAVLREGAPAHVFEKSKFPRHKVCGEFLSPDILRLLDNFGLMDDFEALRPAPVRRAALYVGRREKNFLLPERAWGLSRAAFDHFLLRAAEGRGAVVTQATVTSFDKPAVVARGRHFTSTASERGQRLFGFKAHFRADSSDTVELYFFNSCYVGLNIVENGVTNVCGIAPEHLLARFNFEHDELLRFYEPLRARLRNAERVMPWLSTGPLRFENRFHAEPEECTYTAGDALSFVDPFTGSGLLAAIKTGTLAGQFAAREQPVQDYLNSVRAALERPFAIAGIFRWAITSGWGERLAPLLPGAAMFRWTRP
jgi:flavin-dependent dehydrogenase